MRQMLVKSPKPMFAIGEASRARRGLSLEDRAGAVGSAGRAQMSIPRGLAGFVVGKVVEANVRGDEGQSRGGGQRCNHS